jgi:predicted negative regulator of RcsB-dependent stress response
MEHTDVVCPEPEFKSFVRKRLESKVSWTMAGVVVAIVTGIAFLVFNAYSRGQEEQTSSIKENSAQVQELKTNVKVMQVEFGHVRDKLQDLKDSQKIQTEAILLKLDELSKQRRERR